MGEHGQNKAICRHARSKRKLPNYIPANEACVAHRVRAAQLQSFQVAQLLIDAIGMIEKHNGLP
jgi:hypothetical protein